jgi:hypothetical protein
VAGLGLLDLVLLRVQTGAAGAGPLLRTTVDLLHTRVIDEIDPRVAGARGVAWRHAHAEAVDAALTGLGDLLSAAALLATPLPKAAPGAVPSRLPLFDPEPTDG